MTQEEKELLLKDLSARLLYGVKGIITYNGDKDIFTIKGIFNILFLSDTECCKIEDFKPFLRPMSSMTEEEKEELLNLIFDKEAKYFYVNEEGLIDGKTLDLMKEGLNYPSFCPINIKLYIDFLLSHHFDYRGLVEKGLALKAPEGMY